MSSSPPDNKASLLPWKLLPRWLRLLRVMMITVWAVVFTCLAAMFVLQYQVSTSPRSPTGAYVHFVRFKGGTFYLADPLFGIWTTLDRAWTPAVAVMMLLMMACTIFEGRIKRRRWQALLSEVADRQEGPANAD